ncbi:hypothetical protein SO802_029665 [Lithocarpus litseifolius]|uniref:Reverse transcriptase zinc-binding domain-containing protein n=1 Tax=Lithocarpus litseifolius TaxID=425828 RepID=A0AAW2BVR1_9ROSI
MIYELVVPGFKEAKVSALINPVTRRWDTYLLRGLFHPTEVALILSIPLSPLPVEDKVIWPFNSSGVYSVKSGSRFLANEAILSPLQAYQHQHEDIWKRIWSLAVPNKVRNFLWCACRNAIPVKRNLWKRRIIMDDKCEHCLSAPETTYHALWECPKHSEVWEAFSGCEFRQVRSFSSIRELVDFGFSEDKNMELMVMVMWTFWYRRNQIRTRHLDFPASQVIPQASQALSDFKQHNISLPLQQGGSGQSWVRRHWSIPPTDCFKVYFDGATFPELGKAGLGVVVQNWEGNVMASLSEQAPLPFSPDIVEAMAAARAISFAQELGIRPFILEGDSEVVIETFMAAEESLSSFGHIISLAKSTLDTNECISFSRTVRCGNKVAHNLARHVRGLFV